VLEGPVGNHAHSQALDERTHVRLLAG
jgi:hypothetical protein